ncbi:hypothetical protein BC938DRAFT_472388 [Jimgerdemannia flammicorona]|uniref:Uncharacterized protein n=1 Tax=Jimgerdemannia flammicorona TaxID=994334 RepID=A0A433QTY2_9FUNG|nr:hypothetical protein BC938DRAFT_472388 [Jimgerdemannia flammicorona]
MVGARGDLRMEYNIAVIFSLSLYISCSTYSIRSTLSRSPLPIFTDTPPQHASQALPESGRDYVHLHVLPKYDEGPVQAGRGGHLRLHQYELLDLTGRCHFDASLRNHYDLVRDSGPLSVSSCIPLSIL